MKLQPASEMSKVADENYEKFKQSVLDSEEFEDLITGIKEAADGGQKTFLFNICTMSDPRIVDIFESELTEAGYKVKCGLFNLNAMQITW
ncbi:hypothetical protein [Lysinibacillus sp. Ag94]|uniref:hypothetical protein n=1 Tax=Lysinibacillus sp. Ag94 TaxID=2936682 RepID=UPI00200F158C|nr:hypothetical protein [Lysinibacillus sp. Ag94]UPW82751.1 hypothetical protein MY533_18850 [Lysinibacillus sp. Ag94]